MMDFCMLFRWYKHETLYDILKPAVGTDAALRIMEDHFAELTRRMGYRQLPLEERLSDFVNYLMYKGLKEKALAFAALNVRNYPNSVRAKEHMEAVWWGIKKDLANLVGSLEPEALYRFCKEDAAKENPEYNLSEEAMNGLGYQLLQENKWKEAETVLRLNTELYPEAYNTWGQLWRMPVAVRANHRSSCRLPKIARPEPEQQPCCEHPPAAREGKRGSLKANPPAGGPAGG